MVLKPENCYIVLYGSYIDKIIAVNKKNGIELEREAKPEALVNNSLLLGTSVIELLKEILYSVCT